MKTLKKKLMLRDVVHLLMEEGAPINPSDPQPIPMELQNLSLDMKVDSYFMKYEKESLPTQQNYQVPGTDLGVPGGLLPSQASQGSGVTPTAPVGGIEMQEGFKKTFLALLAQQRPALRQEPGAPADGPAAGRLCKGSRAGRSRRRLR
jgi:hypothetical protein